METVSSRLSAIWTEHALFGSRLIGTGMARSIAGSTTVLDRGSRRSAFLGQMMESKTRGLFSTQMAQSFELKPRPDEMGSRAASNTTRTIFLRTLKKTWTATDESTSGKRTTANVSPQLRSIRGIEVRPIVGWSTQRMARSGWKSTMRGPASSSLSMKLSLDHLDRPRPRAPMCTEEKGNARGSHRENEPFGTLLHNIQRNKRLSSYSWA